MANRLQIRRDTASRWTSVNPTLMSGEIGLETDTNKIKIGDGVKTWNQLNYFASGENNETGIFWAVKGTTTVQQIQDALDAGKVVYAVRDTFIYRLTDNNSTSFRFFSFYNICTFRSFGITKSNGTWSEIANYSPLLTIDRITSTSATVADDNKIYTALKTKNLIDALQATIPTTTKQFTIVYDDATTETLNVTAEEVL